MSKEFHDSYEEYEYWEDELEDEIEELKREMEDDDDDY